MQWPENDQDMLNAKFRWKDGKPAFVKDVIGGRVLCAYRRKNEQGNHVPHAEVLPVEEVRAMKFLGWHPSEELFQTVSAKADAFEAVLRAHARRDITPEERSNDPEKFYPGTAAWACAEYLKNHPEHYRQLLQDTWAAIRS